MNWQMTNEAWIAKNNFFFPCVSFEHLKSEALSLSLPLQHKNEFLAFTERRMKVKKERNWILGITLIETAKWNGF